MLIVDGLFYTCISMTWTFLKIVFYANIFLQDAYFVLYMICVSVYENINMVSSVILPRSNVEMIKEEL